MAGVPNRGGGNYNPGPRLGKTEEAEERRKATLFKAGNPGRPKGTRIRLTERFIKDVYEDWESHGLEALRRTREEDPSVYVRVIASLVPKEVEISRPLNDMSDEELADAITLIRATIGERPAGAGTGGEDQAVGKPH